MSRGRKRTCGEGEMWGAVREEGGGRGGPSGEEGLQVGGACGDQGTGRGERGGSGEGRRRGRGVTDERGGESLTYFVISYSYRFD